MVDSVLLKDKDFIPDDNNETKKLNQIITLPSVVTVCLAPHDKCLGFYVDTTKSFRLRCRCPCHQEL